MCIRDSYGDYAYKFMADGNWAIDEYNSSYEDDGYGGSNSVISFYGKNSLQSELTSLDICSANSKSLLL